MKKKLNLFLVLLFLSNFIQAQRIIGYYPNYAANAATAYNQVQYTKLTHLFYFTINPDETSSFSPTSNGNLWINDSWSWFTMSTFTLVKNHINTLGAGRPKFILVTGGAPGSDWNLNARFLDIGSTPSKLNKFCNQLVVFINTHGMDGWDLDWEFPNTLAERNAHQAIIQKMRTKLDSLENVNCKQYEISMAVGGNYTDVPLPAAKLCWNPANTDQMNQATINLVDYFNLMTYDGNTGTAAPCGNTTSHQHYDLMVKAYTDWRNAYTIPASKINIGVGFYNNPTSGGTAFNSGGNNNTYYNQTYWNNGGSGCPNMRSKIDYAKANGNAGLMIWHILQDNLCTGTTPACYSLLDCIYQYTISSWGTPPAPTNPCSMPVDFIDFTATRTQQGVILYWSTASEVNHNYFSVERSLDGVNFREVQKNKEKNNGIGIHNYETFDLNDINQTLYYRIAQYDLDGTVDYSSIVSVSSDENYFGLQIANNPFTETLSIQANSNNIEAKALIAIYDINGKAFESKEIPLNETIEMGKELPAGFYTISLNVSGAIKRFKVIKQ